MLHQLLVGTLLAWIVGGFTQRASAGETPVSLSLVASTAGDEAEVRLTLVVAEHWHIYGKTPGPTGQQKLLIDLQLPAGVRALSDWTWPEPETVWDGGEIQIYSGKQIFRRKLKVAVASGDISLVASVSYQACTDTMCAPPQTVELTTTLKMVRK